nr:hypothetical protein Iba_chr04cCG18050 [Ipomoea batatas]
MGIILEDQIRGAELDDAVLRRDAGHGLPACPSNPAAGDRQNIAYVHFSAAPSTRICSRRWRFSWNPSSPTATAAAGCRESELMTVGGGAGNAGAVDKNASIM